MASAAGAHRSRSSAEEDGKRMHTALSLKKDLASPVKVEVVTWNEDGIEEVPEGGVPTLVRMACCKPVRKWYARLDKTIRELGVPPSDQIWVDSNRFNMSMTVVLVLNALVIGMETDTESADATAAFGVINDLFLFVYMAELGCRFFYHGLATLHDGFNNFDLFLILVSGFERVFFSGGGVKVLPVLRLIRLFRLIRLVRLLRFFRELWLVVVGIAKSFSTLGWVSLILVSLLWICGMFAQMVIGNSTRWLAAIGAEGLPPFEAFDNFEYFGTVTRSAFSLFQITTLDHWAQHVVRPIIEEYPTVVLFFLFFIFITSFGFMNVIVGNMVNDAIVSAKSNEESMELIARKERVNLCKEIDKFFAACDSDGDGRISEAELTRALRWPKLRAAFHKLGWHSMSAREILKIFDKSGDGEVDRDEFVKGILKMRGETSGHDICLLLLDTHGLTLRVQVFEDRLERLTQKIREVTNVLRFAMEGVRASKIKACKLEVRASQLKALELGETQTIQFDDVTGPVEPVGETNDFMTFLGTKILCVGAPDEADTSLDRSQQRGGGQRRSRNDSSLDSRHGRSQSDTSRFSRSQGATSRGRSWSEASRRPGKAPCPPGRAAMSFPPHLPPGSDPPLLPDGPRRLPPRPDEDEDEDQLMPMSKVAVNCYHCLQGTNKGTDLLRVLNGE